MLESATFLVLDPSRHLCITAGADPVARLERRRGLYTLSAHRLLAPGTDDLERGKGVKRARTLHGFMANRATTSFTLVGRSCDFTL